MSKVCSKCKLAQPIELFGKLKSSSDGLRYDCKICRKEYREQNKDHITLKLREYYSNNKSTQLIKNKEYRLLHADNIKRQRKEYRNREEIKAHIKHKQQEYLPIRKEKIKLRRQTDLNFKISEVLRSKIHKFLKNQPTSFIQLIECDLDFFKKWVEFRFEESMNWENFGSVWQLDHIIPLTAFDMGNDSNKRVCFHWTNFQPLFSNENRTKSNNIQLHYYFNNIVNVCRFNSVYTNYLGYQAVNESLQWLRSKLRYGKNPQHEVAIATEIGNQQPSL